MPIIIPDPEKKARDFLTLIESDFRDRSAAMRMKNFIRNLYYGMNQRVLRYAGQSDIHLYVMAEKIETIVAKEMNAFFAIDPHVHVKKSPNIPDEIAVTKEKMVNWAIDIDIPNLYNTFESWLRNRHLDSVAAVMPWYNFEERHSVILEDAGTTWMAGEDDLTGQKIPEERLKVPYEILYSMFPKLEVLEAKRDEKDIDPIEEQPLEGLTFIINFVEKRVDHLEVLVHFRHSKFTDTIEVATFRKVTVKDNVEVDVIDFEDLIVPFRARDLQSAERVVRQHWLTISQVKKKIEFEGWEINEEDLKHLRNRGLAEKQEEHPDERQMAKKQKDRVVGLSGFQQNSGAVELAPYVDDKILIFEVYATEDLDHDNIYEEVIYQIPYGLRKVVKAEYLEEVFPHGRRPFAEIRSIPISNRYYGWSLGQILAPINIEVDAIINMTNDAQEMINNPIFFYVPTALHGDPGLLKNLAPGSGVPVNEIGGVMFPKFQQQPLANLTAMDSLLMYADKMTVSPQASGSSQVRNAPRTARGTLALLSESGIKVDGFITAAQKGGWSELMFQICALYEHYGSDETWTKVTGMAKQPHTRSQDLRDRTKFSFKGNTVNTNREVMRAMAQVIYNTLMVNPLYATDPVALRNVTEFFLRHFQDSGDVDNLLPSLPPGVMRKPMSQEEEIELMVAGIPMDILPGDDDATHMQKIHQFQGSQRFGTLTGVEIGLLASHLVQHQRAMVAKQQQGTVQAGATQANNVPQGISQDLNVLEGGVQ